MGIAALDTMHAPRVLGLVPTKKPRRRPASFFLQVGHLQGMKVPVLGVGDPCLTAEIQAPERHSMAGVGVGRDDQPARLVYQAVGGQHISRRSDLCRAQVELFRGDVQLDQ